MNRRRRTLLAMAGGTGALALAGRLTPVRARPATWNKSGFEAKAAPDAIKNLRASNLIESKDSAIRAPASAEHGAVVPIEVPSRTPNTQSTSIGAEKNPLP